ncbi:thiolase family protein [Sporichthya polymorpha]|uniref:thiolase family protein n=1 Tax=Sporichthya polymorpha TaxID=35751 RepID=UPI0003A7CAC3|nr:thiolase family protein [Sporichthya polymorpha]
MSAPVIVSACRTPIGTAFKGTLTQTSALDLAGVVLAEAVERSGAPADAFDDVILGESMYGGGVIARYAAVAAGLTEVPGMAVNRHCATSLSSLCMAAGSIAAGMDQLVIAGGVTSASTAPRTLWRIGVSDEWEEAFSPSHPDRADAPNVDMSVTVGWNAARSRGVSREEMDDWAHRSHERAVAAQDAGLFDSEIVPVPVLLPDGTTARFERDEHPRRGVPREKLAALKVLHPEIEGFSITAANSSGVNDGAAALAVASEARSGELGLPVLGRVLSWASVGVDPHDTGLAPIKAIPLALKRAGLSIADVDLWEINEAFAVVPLVACRELGIDDGIVNVSGSGCSLGHPIAATGARMVVTLTHELGRRGGGIAVAAMCAGGGMGTAVVLDIASV